MLIRAFNPKLETFSFWNIITTMMCKTPLLGNLLMCDYQSANSTWYLVLCFHADACLRHMLAQTFLGMLQKRPWSRGDKRPDFACVIQSMSMISNDLWIEKCLVSNFEVAFVMVPELRALGQAAHLETGLRGLCTTLNEYLRLAKEVLPAGSVFEFNIVMIFPLLLCYFQYHSAAAQISTAC